jgi:hypothetical protein
MKWNSLRIGMAVTVDAACPAARWPTASPSGHLPRSPALVPPARRKSDAVITVLMWSSVVLRVVAIVGRRAYVYFDSIDYETLDFTGRARRPWVTPLLYRLVGDLDLRVLTQAAIGAVAWVVLAREVAASINDQALRRLAVGAVLALSLTTSITNWDTTMLSESLALSMTALLVAAYLRFSRAPSVTALGLVAVSSLVWVFTRQSSFLMHALVVVGIGAGFGVRVLRRRRLPRLGMTLFGALVVVASLAGVSYTRNAEIKNFNLAMVIGQRVVTDPDALVWFRGHGMPLPTSAKPGEVIFPGPLLEDAAFAAWVADHGLRTYAEYLARHPWSTLTAPLEDFVTTRPSYGDPPVADEAMLSPAQSYGSSRRVIPEPLEALLFDPGGTGTVLGASVVTLGITAWRRRIAGWDRRWIVPLSAIALTWPALILVWHTSAAELGRLALVPAVFVRIGLLVQAAFLVDGWRSEQAERSARTASRRR